MGHWMNNNADQVFASAKYRFIRGLEALVWARYIRQGERPIQQVSMSSHSHHFFQV